MGLFTEPALDELVERGCPCGSHALSFRTYVDGRIPLQGGEPVGKFSWMYDGEKFVDGVFEATCAACKQVLFHSDVCPRCNAAGKLEVALTGRNSYPVPAECPECGLDEVKLTGFVPARVQHDGGRAQPARTQIDICDAGFHGFRVDCADCGKVAELTAKCPLCEAPAPLRARPG